MLCIIIDVHYLILLQERIQNTTKSVIEILEQGKHEKLCIVIKNVQTKKENKIEKKLRMKVVRKS